MCVATRVDHPVGMQDKKSHMGIVDRCLGPGLPCLTGLGIAAEGTDELDLRQIAKNRRIQVTKLAANHKVQQLLGFDFGMLGHGRLFEGLQGL